MRVWSFLVRMRRRLRSEQVLTEIHDEFEFHIEQRTADNIKRGLPPEEARRAADRAFGSRTQLMDAAYRVRESSWLETFAFDLRYALRRLWKVPAFSIPALVILVFGIGANTVLFSVLSAALLSRPPVPAPDEVVRVYAGRSVAFPRFTILANATSEEVELAAFAQRPFSIRLKEGYAERVVGEVVTPNYFAMLRVTPIEGRLWEPHGQTVNAVPVVLSETFARRLNPTTLARSDIWVNGQPGVVVGIVPASFTGSNPGFTAHAWVPIQSLSTLSARLHDDRDRWLSMIGRLRPQVSKGQLQAHLTGMSANLKLAPEDTLRVQAATGLAVAPDSRAPFVASLGALTAVMAVVLLVAGASVGNLLLARSMSARAETALRLALGASRLRVAQQILCETLLLSVVAGLFSIVLGMGLVAMTPTMVVQDYGFPVLEMRITTAAALFTMMVACVAGVLFGVLPARRLWTVDIRVHLRDLVGSTSRRSRASALLVVAQVAGSVLLLMTAGLFVYAVHSATSRTPEVARRVLVVPLALAEAGYSDARAGEFTTQASARLLAAPGVQSVSLAQFGLYSGSSNLRLIVPPSEPPLEVESNSVGPGYFRTLHLPLVAGREFGRTNTGSASSEVIVNAALAQRLRVSPIHAIGLPLRLGVDGPVARIVAVVANTENVRPGEGHRPFLYEPLPPGGSADVALHVEATTDGNAVAQTVRTILRQLDPNLPLYRLRTLEEQMRVALAPSKAASVIATALGAVALLLASAGVYGIVAFLIATRTREIGIRIALGASRAEIIRLVSRDAVRVTVVGIATGLLLALVGRRLLDPYVGSAAQGIFSIGTATAALVCGSIALAAWAPVRRSVSTDPVRSLRAE